MTPFLNQLCISMRKSSLKTVSARHPQALFSSWPDKHNPWVHTMKNRNGIWSNHFFIQWFLKKQHCTHYRQEKKPGLDWLGAIKKLSALSVGSSIIVELFLVLCWWKAYRKSLVRGFSLSLMCIASSEPNKPELGKACHQHTYGFALKLLYLACTAVP